MKVNKESWHYKRLAEGVYSDGEIPKTLCPYFWKVNFTLFTALLVCTAIAAALFVMVIAPLVELFYYLYFNGFTFNEMEFTHVAMIFYTVIILIGLWALIQEVIIPGIKNKVNDIGDYVETVEYKEIKTPIEKAVMFLNVIKGKVCPILEFK